MKKLPSKVAHNWPRFFFSTGPAAQTAQKQKSHTTTSPLMQNWLFRLGLHTNTRTRDILKNVIRLHSTLLGCCNITSNVIRDQSKAHLSKEKPTLCL